ncbi:MAG: small basic family protein [Clostridia bacterium]
MLPILGLILGVIIGIFFIPFNISPVYSIYVAVGILAALDSIFGAFSARLQNKFDLKIFISGFFGNAIIAAGLAYVGDQLGMPLYLAAIFAFGNRLFLNFALIRRILLSNMSKKDKIVLPEQNDEGGHD